MGGTAEVLPASRLRKRMAREVDVGERERGGQSERGSSRVDSRTRSKADRRQTRPDQTRPEQPVTRVRVASEPTLQSCAGVVDVVVGFALVAGRFGAALGKELKHRGRGGGERRR